MQEVHDNRFRLTFRRGDGHVDFAEVQMQVRVRMRSLGAGAVGDAESATESGDQATSVGLASRSSVEEADLEAESRILRGLPLSWRAEARVLSERLGS